MFPLWLPHPSTGVDRACCLHQLLQSFIPMLLASLGSDSLTLTGRLSSMPWLAAAVVGMMAGVTADR